MSPFFFFIFEKIQNRIRIPKKNFFSFFSKSNIHSQGKFQHQVLHLRVRKPFWPTQPVVFLFIWGNLIPLFDTTDSLLSSGRISLALSLASPRRLRWAVLWTRNVYSFYSPWDTMQQMCTVPSSPLSHTYVYIHIRIGSYMARTDPTMCVGVRAIWKL